MKFEKYKKIAKIGDIIKFNDIFDEDEIIDYIAHVWDIEDGDIYFCRIIDENGLMNIYYYETEKMDNSVFNIEVIGYYSTIVQYLQTNKPEYFI